MQLNKQNALSRLVSGLSSGGGAERNRRRVNGSSCFDLRLHRLAAVADGGGFGEYDGPILLGLLHWAYWNTSI